MVYELNIMSAKQLAVCSMVSTHGIKSEDGQKQQFLRKMFNAVKIADLDVIKTRQREAWFMFQGIETDDAL